MTDRAPLATGDGPSGGDRASSGGQRGGDRAGSGGQRGGDRAGGDTQRGGDRLAATALALGGAIALAGLRVPLQLVVGVAVAASGVLLALRGDRPVVAPRLLALALAASALALVGSVTVALYQDWQIGQRLAEGASPAGVTTQLAGLARLRAGLRAASLFSSLALLLGATLTRLSSK